MEATMEIVIFFLGTIALMTISRRALLHPRSHGFYRFFAWEILWIMFLLNARGWFSDPSGVVPTGFVDSADRLVGARDSGSEAASRNRPAGYGTERPVTAGDGEDLPACDSRLVSVTSATRCTVRCCFLPGACSLNHPPGSTRGWHCSAPFFSLPPRESRSGKISIILGMTMLPI